MQASDVLDRARRMLDDTENTPNAYRWSNATLIDYLNDGIRDIRARWPEYRLNEDEELINWNEIEDTDEDIIIDDEKCLVPLTHYVCFMAFLQDSDEEGDFARSNHHFQMYERSMIT